MFSACRSAVRSLILNRRPIAAFVRPAAISFTDLLATKRGLASALHSGDPAFSRLPDYFLQRLGPTRAALLKAAVADGTVRDDLSAEDLLHAITQLSQPVPGRGPEHNQRIVAVFVDGLPRRLKPFLNCLATPFSMAADPQSPVVA